MAVSSTDWLDVSFCAQCSNNWFSVFFVLLVDLQHSVPQINVREKLRVALHVVGLVKYFYFHRLFLKPSGLPPSDIPVNFVSERIAFGCNAVR